MLSNYLWKPWVITNHYPMSNLLCENKEWSKAYDYILEHLESKDNTPLLWWNITDVWVKYPFKFLIASLWCICYTPSKHPHVNFSQLMLTGYNNCCLIQLRCITFASLSVSMMSHLIDPWEYEVTKSVEEIMSNYCSKITRMILS